MKHYRLNCSKITGLFILTVWLIVAIGISNVSALMLDTSPQNSRVEEMKKDPGAFLDFLKQELRLGQVGYVVDQGEQLSKILPENSDIQSLLVIAYVTQDNITKAQTALSKAKANQVKSEEALTLCGEAMILRPQKQYDSALKLAQQAIALDPSHPYLWNVLGRIFFDIKKYPKAIESFQKSVSLEPKFSPGYTNLGNTFLLQGDFVGAEKNFTKALTVDNNNFAAHQGLSVVYEANSQFDLAVKHFSRSYKDSSEDPTVLRRLGTLQIKAKQYIDALATGQQMRDLSVHGANTILADAALHLGHTQEALSYCQQDPQDLPDIAYSCGFVRMVNGEYKKALASMDVVLSMDKHHFGAYAARAVLQLYLDQKVDLDVSSSLWNSDLRLLLNYFDGNLSFSQDRVSDALAKWKRAENMIPGFSVFGVKETDLDSGLLKDEIRFLNLGVLYYFRDLLKEAQGEFDKALRKNPTSIFANYWIAQLQLKKSDKKMAIAAYEKAIQKSPDFFVSLYAIGELQFLTGHADQAVIFYKRALSVKQDAGVMIKLGIYYEMEGEFDKAANYYSKTIAAYPQLFIGYNQLAWLYAKQKKSLVEAMRLATEADKLQPGNASILDTMGWIYYHQKNYVRALEKTELSLEVKPDNPTVLYHLAIIQLKIGNQEDAKKNLQTALASKFLFDEIEEVKAMLKNLQ